ncbi:exodeoxyribonuclease VII small subunit [Rhodopirellula bahusiensis]|uniref:Exodeoxyribonuclease 7 small subunit n=1 Tax=Rhodopirellula bahusiensis TaxID=2014065 RepID=A0A2G1WC90_9BACT|nr:exodeoxyribonuclease VII small subunit [Rhodopirellula bahusiensis]PHQ36652.1 exodeoxyribonuclease VII small subunit [Rhodopirellula bahusiensis]
MAKKKRNPSEVEAGDGEQSAAELGDFEATLGDVETIVRKLESGSLTLDDSLKQYEVAVAKMRQCYQLLDVAERKISVLAGVDAEGRPVTEPLETMSGGESLIQKQASRGKRRGAGGADSSSGESVGDEFSEDDE